MYSEARRAEILSLLAGRKYLSVKEIAERLFCSISTVRRDLIAMERDGIVKRGHGGAALVCGANVEYSSSFRAAEQVEQKAYIAELAADFIADGMSLFLDSSSTAAKLCPAIAAHAGMTVITNDLHVAMTLNESDTVQVFIAGGPLKKGAATSVGSMAGASVGQFRTDLAFISCRGIDTEGIYEANQQQAWVKQRMIQNAKAVVLLCDSSKFGQSYFLRLCPFAALTAVVTDRRPSGDIAGRIAAAGCELLF